MKFNMPTASRKRLEELLEYLGDRTDDFKKCFDIESEWCWKYADLVLRGLKKRDLEYSEGHHVVPASFYGKRCCHKVDAGNLTTLTYVEHVWVHYCACYCATGKMHGKMVKAFLTMYSIGICKKRPLMPSEVELLAAIPEMEIKRIRAMEPQWAKVESEGRTHRCNDPVQYKKDYYEANKDKLAEQMKDYRKANKEKIAERKKDWYEENKEQISEYMKDYYATNKEKILEQRKAYCDANKEQIAEYKKDYYKANKEQISEYKKDYYEANKDKILENNKAYREANKDKILENNKAYREANKEQISEYQKDYYKANKEQISEYQKDYYEANKEKIAKKNKAYAEANKERIAEYKKDYYEANKEQISEYKKAWCEAKKAAGYRRRKNPLTGKREWVFVGLPEFPKSTEVA